MPRLLAIILCAMPVAGGPLPAPGPIAFGECDQAGVSQIVSAPLEGVRQQLTRGPYPCWFPAYSPDATRIAYCRESPGGGIELWIMAADGSGPSRLIGGGINLAPCWSPDGRRIAFARGAPTAPGLKIWVTDADGTHAHPLLSEQLPGVDENVPRWSPDGIQIVFTSNRRGGLYEIWTADADAGKVLGPLTRAHRDAALAAAIEQKVPSWSPDGKYIVYWQGVEGTDPRPNLPRDVWIMSSDGTGHRKLCGGDDPNWSPDGRTIILSRGNSGRPELAGISPDGTNFRTLLRVRACRPLQSSWARARSR